MKCYLIISDQVTADVHKRKLTDKSVKKCFSCFDGEVCLLMN